MSIIKLSALQIVKILPFDLNLEKRKKELNEAMMLKLSKHINSVLELNCLAIIGLHLDGKVVNKHINNNKEFNMAVYGVLIEWSNSIGNSEDAYRILYEALGKEGVDMKNHRNSLEKVH